jgi:hypothetical protein
MPRDDRLWPDEDEAGPPLPPESRDRDPQQPISEREPHTPKARAFQDPELMSQREDFELQGRPRVQGCAYGLKKRLKDGHREEA